jgi:hypothetical protein
MPRGPKGEKRPADVIGNAVHVMRIATGEIEEKLQERAQESRASLGRRGGKNRAERLSEKRRSEIAKKAATIRWKKKAARDKATST